MAARLAAVHPKASGMGIGSTGDSHARPSPSVKPRGACSIRLAIRSRRFCGRQMGAPPHESAVSFLKKTAQLGNGRRGSKSMTAFSKEGNGRRAAGEGTVEEDMPAPAIIPCFCSTSSAI
jgi:hypothetical protein